MQRASRDASSDGVADYLHAVSALGLRTQLLCMYLGAAAAKRRSTAWTQVLRVRVRIRARVRDAGARPPP